MTAFVCPWSRSLSTLTFPLTDGKPLVSAAVRLHGRTACMPALIDPVAFRNLLPLSQAPAFGVAHSETEKPSVAEIGIMHPGFPGGLWVRTSVRPSEQADTRGALILGRELFWPEFGWKVRLLEDSFELTIPQNVRIGAYVAQIVGSLVAKLVRAVVQIRGFFSRQK